MEKAVGKFMEILSDISIAHDLAMADCADALQYLGAKRSCSLKTGIPSSRIYI
jgi:hypothetical protein